MLSLLLPTLLVLAFPDAPTVIPATPVPAVAGEPAVAPVPAPAPAVAPAAVPAIELKPLSFFSQKYEFKWDRLLPLTVEVDGLKVNSIFFNRRTSRFSLFKGTDFGTRAQVEVTNTASATRIPGFAVAVFDAEDRLLGVATGGPTIGGVSPGATETFDLSFHQVLERLPKGDHFHLTIELAP